MATITKTNEVTKTKFTASRVDFILHCIVWYSLAVFSLFTLYPYIYVRKIRYLTYHSVMDGKKLVFVGTVKECYKKLSLYFFLEIITLGIFYFFVKGKMLKWQIENTHFVDNGPRNRVSCFNYKLSDYAIVSINGFIYTILTLGFGYPYYLLMKTRAKEDHRKIDGKPTLFVGEIAALYGTIILNFILTYITGGLYKPFKDYGMEKYIRTNVVFKSGTENYDRHEHWIERFTNKCLRHKGWTLAVYIIILLGLIALVAFILYLLIMKFIIK